MCESVFCLCCVCVARKGTTPRDVLKTSIYYNDEYHRQEASNNQERRENTITLVTTSTRDMAKQPKSAIFVKFTE